MTVRAKMRCASAQVGKTGVVFSFYPVYEGSTELQKISENAIFGDATPGGDMMLVADPGKFHAGGGEFDQEEYYIDFLALGDEPPKGALALFHARLAFRSEPYQHDPQAANFRHVADSPASATIQMYVRNPGAVAWLDANPEVLVAVRLARGKRSDAEIALIAKEVEDAQRPHVRKNWNNDERYEAYIASLQRKLAIAKGEL